MHESNYSTNLQTGNLWANTSDGSLCVHTDAIIRVPPEINNHLVTTLPNPKGNVPITASPSINGIARLVIINDRVVLC